jgi:hypothetical protein
VAGEPEAFFAHVCGLCEEQADDLRTAVDRYTTATAPAAAPASLDHRRVLTSVRSADRQALWARVQLNCLHLAVNVADHVRALGVLIAAPNVGLPIYAHATLARVAVESAAWLGYVLDRNCPFDVRFARGIAHLLADADAARRGASKIPGNAYMPPPTAEGVGKYDQLQQLIVRARIVLVPGRKGVKGVRLATDAPEEPMDVKATDLVQMQFRELPGIYQLLSGVTHAMPWRLGDSVTVAGGTATWAPDPVDIGGSVLAALAAGHRAVAAEAWHRGFEGDPALAVMHERFTAANTLPAAFQRAWLARAGARPTIARFLI